jgi:hypothetical protein
MQAAFVASLFCGAFPPVDLRAVCLVRSMVLVDETLSEVKSVSCEEAETRARVLIVLSIDSSVRARHFQAFLRNFFVPNYLPTILDLARILSPPSSAPITTPWSKKLC